MSTAERYRAAIERMDIDAVSELFAQAMGERAQAAGLQTTRA